MDLTLHAVIRRELGSILKNRSDVAKLACVQRAKFEGWLKFELAIALSKWSGITELNLEDSYPSNGRSDFSFVYEKEKYLVEMKTANTNWRVDGVENLHRPVTKNITGIIEDVQVLRSKAPPAHGIAVFTIFPIPLSVIKNTPGQLSYHLMRIEKELEIKEGFLREVMDYIPVLEGYGIGSFVLEVI